MILLGGVFFSEVNPAIPGSIHNGLRLERPLHVRPWDTHSINVLIFFFSCTNVFRQLWNETNARPPKHFGGSVLNLGEAGEHKFTFRKG